MRVEAGPFVPVYDALGGQPEPWYVDDHTFVRDRSGVWHLFGITHAEPARPHDEEHLTQVGFLDSHASEGITDTGRRHVAEPLRAGGRAACTWPLRWLPRAPPQRASAHTAPPASHGFSSGTGRALPGPWKIVVIARRGTVLTLAPP